MSADAFKDRLKAVMGEKSNRSFAVKCGISEGTLRSYLRGGTYPPLDTLGMIAKATGVRLAWLASGEEPMVWAEAAAVSERTTRYEDAEDLQKEYVLAPRYKIRVSAGGGALVESEQVVDHLAFKSQWIRSTMHMNPADLLLISAMGDSMYPTIREGDLLLVDKSRREVRDDAIYVMRLDNTLIAKRLQKLYDGSIQVKNDNKAYDTQLVPHDLVGMLYIIGRVVWVGGLV